MGGEFVEAGGADSYYCTAGQWSNGLLELKGNFTQLPGAGGQGNTFDSQVAHVVKLIGSSTQAIRLTNPGSSKFTKLFVMANTDTNGLSRVSLPLGLNFPWTLYENTALGGPFVMGNVALNLNGYSLKVAGDLKHSTGTITLNGGTAARTNPNLDITGNYLVMTSGTRNADGTWTSVTASTGCIYSTNVGDWIRVGGEFVEAGGADSYYCTAGQWSNGLLELKGNFTQLPGAGGQGNTFNSQGGHVLKLVGNATQAIRMSNPSSSRWNIGSPPFQRSV